MAIDNARATVDIQALPKRFQLRSVALSRPL